MENNKKRWKLLAKMTLNGQKFMQESKLWPSDWGA